MEILAIMLLLIWGALILIDFRMVQIANKFIEYINEKEIKNRTKKD